VRALRFAGMSGEPVLRGAQWGVPMPHSLIRRVVRIISRRKEWALYERAMGRGRSLDDDPGAGA
jgi:hypothetical protein